MSSKDRLHSKKATLRVGINYFQIRKCVKISMETSELGTPEEPRCPEDTAVESCEISDSSRSKKFCISNENTFQMQTVETLSKQRFKSTLSPSQGLSPVISGCTPSTLIASSNSTTF